MDGRTLSRGWPDLFKNKPGLFRMEYSVRQFLLISEGKNNEFLIFHVYILQEDIS